MKYFILLVLLIKLAYSEDSSCKTTEDCTDENEVCVSNKCQCDKLFIKDPKFNICLPYVTEYKGTCAKSEQCDWLGDKAECDRNQCACQKDLHWYQGSCRKLASFGETCSSEIDCYNGYDLRALKCDTTQKCVCSDDYYNRNNDCRKISENNDCALDIDCRNDSLVCERGACTEKKNQEVNANTNRQEDTLLKSNGHFKQELGSCEDGCSDNEICFKNIACVCKPGYFLYEGSCIPELGMASGCKNDKDCLIKPGKCIEGVCYCKDYWFNDDTNQNCIKTSIQTNLNCLSNDWCNVLGPNAFCFMPQSDDDDSICKCSSNSELNKLWFCEKNDKPAGECLRDSECQVAEDCINEKCICKDNYYKKDGVCAPKIGAPCNYENCYAENSKCENGFCKCFADYVTDDEIVCYAFANGLNDTCFKSIQCSSRIDNAICDGTKCVCKNGTKESEGKCVVHKNYGDACSKSTDCTISLGETFICKNSVCQCPTYYTLTEDGSECRASANKLFGSYSILLIAIVSYKVFG